VVTWAGLAVCYLAPGLFCATFARLEMGPKWDHRLWPVVVLIWPYVVWWLVVVIWRTWAER
jgi:hypothetical protein